MPKLLSRFPQNHCGHQIQGMKHLFRTMWGEIIPAWRHMTTIHPDRWVRWSDHQIVIYKHNTIDTSKLNLNPNLTLVMAFRVDTFPAALCSTAGCMLRKLPIRTKSSKPIWSLGGWKYINGMRSWWFIKQVDFDLKPTSFVWNPRSLCFLG